MLNTLQCSNAGSPLSLLCKIFCDSWVYWSIFLILIHSKNIFFYILNELNCLFGFSERGTDQFSVHTSADVATWTQAFQSRLTDARSKDCNHIFVETFSVWEHAQYVRINLETYFGKGAGLQYVSIATNKACDGIGN